LNSTNIDITQNPLAIIQQVRRAKKDIQLIPPGLKELNVETEIKAEASDRLTGLFSSGSTNKPKRIWNTYSNLLENARISANMFEINSRKKILIIAAPWHVAGLTWSLMAEEAGAEYKIMIPKIAQPAEWLSAIEAFRPNLLLTVPTVLRMLYGRENFYVPELGYGGASLEAEDYEKLKNRCQVLFQAYGQTEAGGLIAVYKKIMNTSPKKYEHLCCGFAPSMVKILCDGEPGSPQPILVGSPTSVYEKTYNTGDVGFTDSKGRLYISGRNIDKKDNCNMVTAVTSIAHK